MSADPVMLYLNAVRVRSDHRARYLALREKLLAAATRMEESLKRVNAGEEPYYMDESPVTDVPNWPSSQALNGAWKELRDAQVAVLQSWNQLDAKLRLGLLPPKQAWGGEGT